jgi:hypothetical protein
MFYFVGVTVKVYVADIVNDIIHEPISVRAYQTQSVTEFKKLVSNVSIIERNKNGLWWPSLLMDRDEMSKFYRGPSIDVSYQVSVHLAEGVQRRRLKFLIR